MRDNFSFSYKINDFSCIIWKEPRGEALHFAPHYKTTSYSAVSVKSVLLNTNIDIPPDESQSIIKPFFVISHRTFCFHLQISIFFFRRAPRGNSFLHSHRGKHKHNFISKSRNRSSERKRVRDNKLPHCDAKRSAFS